jgi:hypothetical protein
MRRITALGLSLAAGCHLIGGAGDLEFTDQPGGPGGGGGTGAQGGGGSPEGGGGTGGGTGGGGTGGMSCAEVCIGECQACDADDVCQPDPLLDECGDGLCDGAGTCAVGDTIWSRLFGDDQSSIGYDVAAMSDGGAVVVGSYTSNGPPGFGFDAEATNANAIGGDLFVARLTPAGVGQWAVTAGNTMDQTLRGVVVDADDNIVVAGDYKGTISHNGWDAATSSFQSVFVGKLKPDGDGLWGYTFVTTNADASLRDIAVAADGRVGIAANIGVNATGIANVELRSDVVYAATGGNEENGLVYVVDPTEDPENANSGYVPWGIPIKSTAFTEAVSVTFDSDGHLWVVGNYEGAVTNVPLPNPAGSRLGFAVKLNAGTGQVLDQRAIGTSELANFSILEVTAVPDGIVVVGAFEGTLDIGGGLTETTDDSLDLFVAAFDLDGEAQWLKRFTAAASILDVKALAADSAGNLVFVGSFLGSLQFGPGANWNDLSSQQAFVVKLAATGELLWARRDGSPTSPDFASGVAVDGEGAVLMSGSATGSLFEASDSHHGATDIFVTKLAP